MPDFHMADMPQSFLKTPGQVFGTRKYAGTFGIECELEGENLPPHGPKGWLVHEDRSIRGFEYLTNTPVATVEVRRKIQQLKTHIEENGGQFKKSYRASTHFHMNVAGDPIIHVLGYVAAFCLIEPVMLRVCGPERDGNLFCISTADCGDFSNFVANFIKAVEIQQWGHIARRGKYASLNLDPIWDKGSIEFRFFPSSLDPDEITNWSTWLLRIREMVRNCPDKSYFPLFEAARNMPMNFARQIIPELDVNLFPETSVEQSIALGCENAYEILRVLRRALLKKDVRPTVPAEVEPKWAGWAE